MDRMTGGDLPAVSPVVSPAEMLAARRTVRAVYVDDRIKEYILDLVMATRHPGDNGMSELGGLIAYGASPRASIAMVAAARARAFLHGRGYVSPEDVKHIALDVLRHRVIPTYEAEAEDISSTDMVMNILDRVEVP